MSLSAMFAVENVHHLHCDGNGDSNGDGIDALQRAMPTKATTEAQRVIMSWDGYAVTPMRDCVDLAAALGLGQVFYKDEASRFGLGSFKALGGSYATQKWLATYLDMAIDAVDASCLPADHDLCVITATDGNHGRSVAWGAKRLGLPCRVYMHSGVSAYRAQYIEGLGAEVIRVEGNYDDSVHQVAEDAEKHNWQIIADTAYEGYLEIPLDIMHGYTVMCKEAMDQLPEAPTHCFIPAGCGGLAGAVIGYLAQHWHQTKWVIVEPDLAPSLHLSASNDAPSCFHITDESVMAGLSCGEISLVAWDILKAVDVDYIQIPDRIIQPAMELMVADGIEAGETAVATVAGLCAVMNDSVVAEKIGLDTSSRVMLLGTEGETDPEVYRELLGFNALDIVDNQQRLKEKFYAA